MTWRSISGPSRCRDTPEPRSDGRHHRSNEHRARWTRSARRSGRSPGVWELALAAGQLGSGETTAARAESARRRLREATEAEFARSLPGQELRATTEWGYFDADIGHEAAALKLNISRATYFRRLAEAVERVTVRLTAP